MLYSDVFTGVRGKKHGREGYTAIPNICTGIPCLVSLLGVPNPAIPMGTYSLKPVYLTLKTAIKKTQKYSADTAADASLGVEGFMT